jgi:hypothetical protein
LLDECSLVMGGQIWRLDCTNSTAHLVAGTGEQGPSGDGGPAKEAKLTGPKGIGLGEDHARYHASHYLRSPRYGLSHNR